MDKLNTRGGHVAVSLTLVIIGLVGAHLGVAHGGELVVFGLGVLSRSMTDPQRSTTTTTMSTPEASASVTQRQ